MMLLTTNTPIFQHPISSYAPVPARSDAHSSVDNSRPFPRFMNSQA